MLEHQRESLGQKASAKLGLDLQNMFIVLDQHTSKLVGGHRGYRYEREQWNGKLLAMPVELESRRARFHLVIRAKVALDVAEMV